jgi:molybdopterin molybdotransferase
MVRRRGRRTGARTAEVVLGAAESVRVSTGDPMPIGADAVLPSDQIRVESSLGMGETFVVLRPVKAGDGVVGRGHLLSAGAELAPSGAKLRLPMVALFAAQGWVHPVCHRRVRVAVLAVGDHLVGPGEAPVMHRERNAAGSTIVAPCLSWGATAHDLGVVPESGLAQALDRALTAPVIVVVAGRDGPAARAIERAGVEPVFDGVAIEPGGELSYGVVRDPLRGGRAVHHVFQMTPSPIDVFTGVILLLGPLIARLQGGPTEPRSRPRAVWEGPAQQSADRLLAVPSTVRIDADARLVARPVPYRDRDDLAGFARAEGLALFPPRDRQWESGEVVEIVGLSDLVP